MNDKIEAILKHPWTIPAAIGIASFGGGLGLGFVLGKRRKEVEVFEEHTVPDQLALEWEKGIYPAPEPTTRPPKVVLTPEVAVKKDILKIDNLSELRPTMLDTEEPEVPTVEDSQEDDAPILVNATPIDWDYEKEVDSRTETAPYILHQEEFFADEKNYTQSSLTYFAGDDIMADEDESPVYNYKSVTGELKFGHGSGDPNVVYIRNDERRAEYEISRVDGLYSEEVLGLEIENNVRVADLKHAKNMKFRMD